MSVDSALTTFRASVRKNSKPVIKHVIDNNISRLKTLDASPEICYFCSTENNLTKEHVIPQWTYERCSKKFFTTDINGLNQTYHKTTIPACSTCNNERLSSLERYISNLFSKINLDDEYFTIDESENIIRWLEIIDYKFQILNTRKQFLKSEEAGFIPYLADFPLSVLRDSIDYSPSKAVAEIRRSLKRLTIKNKDASLNSLQILKTSNPSFHFFHSMDNFIFIELPQFNIAVFHFFKRTFPTVADAQIEAKKIVEEVYK